MKSATKWLLGVLGILIIIIIIGISSYNNLVTLDLNVETSKSNIDTQLQRRSDLIPNLVNTVKGYANLEEEIFTDIANARARLAGATSITDEANANAELEGALSRLLLVVENYPTLQSSQNFRDLSTQLEGTENRIAIARQDYNTAVNAYNSKQRRFPTNIIASLFDFERKALFEASAGAEQVPTVDFNEL